MVFIKKVVNSDAGDADHVGGNDWDALDDFFSDINQDSSRTALINTKTRFRDQKLQQRDAADTFTLTHRTPTITANSDTRINRPYLYCVYRDGSTCYCQNMQTGQIESSGSASVPETIFQYAIDNATKSSIYFAPGTYTASTGFTGLAFTGTNREVTLVMDQGFLLQLRTGYTGDLFTISTFGNHIHGGKFAENSAQSRLWTAYHMLGENDHLGPSGNVISGAYVRYAGVGVKMEIVGASAFNNNNAIQDIYFDQFAKGVEFVDDGLGGDIDWNHFRNMGLQTYASSTYGFKDITGSSNLFLDNKVWDATGSCVTANILSTASDTIIIGGIMTNLNFSDLGARTVILEYNKRQIPNWDVQTATAPSNPAANRVRCYSKAVDTNNDGFAIKEKVNGAVVEVLY